jgi:nucleotide-binding universal stress UspA family protein
VWWLGPYAVEAPSVADRQQAAQRAARKVVDEELGHEPGIQIEVLATTMAPAAALIEKSASADLLVVGSRGRGGFRGLVLGSVSMQCMLHAHCPVTVVHAEPARLAATKPAGEAPAEHGLDDARRMATGTFL